MKTRRRQQREQHNQPHDCQPAVRDRYIHAKPALAGKQQRRLPTTEAPVDHHADVLEVMSVVGKRVVH